MPVGLFRVSDNNRMGPVEIVIPAAAMQRLMEVADEMNEKPQSLSLRVVHSLSRRRFQNMDAMIDGVNHVVGAGKPVVVPLGGCSQGQIREVPLAVQGKPGVDVAGLNVIGQRPLTFLGKFQFVGPGGDGGQIIVAEDSLDGGPGVWREHLAGKFADGFVTFQRFDNS